MLSDTREADVCCSYRLPSPAPESLFEQRMSAPNPNRESGRTQRSRPPPQLSRGVQGRHHHEFELIWFPQGSCRVVTSGPLSNGQGISTVGTMMVEGHRNL